MSSQSGTGNSYTERCWTEKCDTMVVMAITPLRNYEATPQVTLPNENFQLRLYIIQARFAHLHSAARLANTLSPCRRLRISMNLSPCRRLRISMNLSPCGCRILYIKTLGFFVRLSELIEELASRRDTKIGI